MDVVTFDNWFARELPELHVEWQPDAVPAPTVVVLNEPLAAELGFDVSFLSSAEGTAALAGNGILPGSTPTAMAYAGHQFGSFSGRLGDGRALLIGEVTDRHGVRRDIHLKGSGRTPFARGGDGKATLGPMLREYLMAEAMHALGIPTGRALSVVATGEQVRREQFEPGAVLARVALSHIRVGTFEYAARVDGDVLRRLADHAIERHHPAAADAGDGRYLALLDAVVEVQAALVARWMLVGFIHGVMNTDNVTISGETIDYGPCAFMERHDPATVYSSIDHGGRYAYGNQPGITQWNLARLAETLLPLIDDDPDAAVAAATDVLDAFTDRYQRHWLAGMRTKLGLEEERPGDDALAADLVGLLHLQRIDHTAAFRALADDLRGDEEAVASLGENRTGLDDWRRSWRDRLAEEGRDAAVVASAMDGVNPIYIPRNHLVHEALEAAVGGDHAPFHELLGIITRPFDERPGLDRFASPAPDSFNDGFQTFCGT